MNISEWKKNYVRLDCDTQEMNLPLSHLTVLIISRETMLSGKKRDFDSDKTRVNKKINLKNEYKKRAQYTGGWAFSECCQCLLSLSILETVTIWVFAYILFDHGYYGSLQIFMYSHCWLCICLRSHPFENKFLIFFYNLQPGVVRTKTVKSTVNQTNK